MSSQDDARYSPTEQDEQHGASEHRWINLNNEYLLPRSFLENCVIYIQRSGSTLVIRTTEEYSDLTIVLPNETSAVRTLNDMFRLFDREAISSNIDFASDAT